MGPTFRANKSIAAGAIWRPLQETGWNYRVLPFNAAIGVSARAGGNAGDVVMTLAAGSDVQAGPDQPVVIGTAFEENVNMFDTYLGARGDEINLSFRNTSAGALTAFCTLRLEPIG
jgi:hypothetical protein